MSIDKTLISNTTAILSTYKLNPVGLICFSYKTQNELRLENQAFIFNFEHHFKTTSL